MDLWLIVFFVIICINALNETYIYIFVDYFTAVAISLPPVSILPFCNSLLQRGPLLPLLHLCYLSNLVLAGLVNASPVMPILVLFLAVSSILLVCPIH
jgi:hypothetical protein